MGAKARYKLNKKLRKEKAAIESAGKKRGLWASIGSTLGSLLAMAVTGGGAAPWVAGLAAGGLSYVGGSLGNFLAKQTKGGKIKGGRFYQGSRESLAGQIQEGVTAGALKSGAMAGLMKMGGKLTFGKGGPSVTSGGTATASTGGSIPPSEGLSGFKFSDIFKGGDKVAGQTGLGKALDFRGSALGKGLGSKFVTNLKGNISTGFKNKSFDWSTLPEGMTPRDYQSKVAGAQAMAPTGDFWSQYESQLADDARTALGKPPSFDEIMSSSTPGPGFKEYGPGEYKIGKSPIQDDLFTNYEFGAGSPTTSTTRGYFPEEDLYDWSGDIEDIGSKTDPYQVLTEQRLQMEKFLENPENRQQYGKALYQEGSVLGDEMTSDLMSKYADPTQSYQAPTESLFDRFKGDIQGRSDLALAKRGFDIERPTVLDDPTGVRQFDEWPIGPAQEGGATPQISDVEGPGLSEFGEWDQPPPLQPQSFSPQYDFVSPTAGRANVSQRAQELQRSRSLQGRIGGGSQWWQRKFGR